MTPSNLCFLWTYILSLTNVLGITNISWVVVLTPTVAIVVFALLILLAAVLAAVVIDDK